MNSESMQQHNDNRTADNILTRMLGPKWGDDNYIVGNLSGLEAKTILEELTALRAENARLREALEAIANQAMHSEYASETILEIIELASAALAATKGEGSKP